ncbi:hypothetical protein CONCODRAFT_12040 [Conidiobolus coronatus NRRL 28638]|uniref:Uncharacterized protein n=1 Tax=Conidiobolus coronatus (strain ATCC 28846 / CBS 209.66 / NRRL 28638) TaxID=796925 RepID=A0A137NTX1_CONC2|nr:hypothetical protein CONCODRAFT_12040 [Conidiobolus coronatus NRRL 28638]|eukprot:KXN66176.1 hypothetical protein CONCODRAFT_12040 [Conidiobolus coronatus NRRL 28638]
MTGLKALILLSAVALAKIYRKHKDAHYLRHLREKHGDIVIDHHDECYNHDYDHDSDHNHHKEYEHDND